MGELRQAERRIEEGGLGLGLGSGIEAAAGRVAGLRRFVVQPVQRAPRPLQVADHCCAIQL